MGRAMLLLKDKIREEDELVSFVVVPEVFKKDHVVFNLECENKTSNMGSFEMIQSGSEIFEVVDERNIRINDLFNLFVNSNCERFIFAREFSEDFFQFIRNLKSETHSNFINLSNFSNVNSEWGPFSASSNSLMKDSFIGSSSTGCQSICSQNSQSSSVTSRVCLNLADMSCFMSLTTEPTNRLESNLIAGSEVISSSINEDSNDDYLKFSELFLQEIANSTGDNVVSIDDKGDMFLAGTASGNSDLTGRTSTNMEFRNSTGDLVGFFDNQGNLKLQGGYAENYASP